MSNWNKVRLVKGEAFLTSKEFEKFDKMDTLFGVDSEPETLKTWDIEDLEEAKEELAGLKSSYIKRSAGVDVVEYALELYEVDEDGEFLSGSDFYTAEEAGHRLKNTYDTDFCFEDLEEAKRYIIDGEREMLEEHDDEELQQYLEELESAETLEEFARIWNSYTDAFENGSRMFVEEF